MQSNKDQSKNNSLLIHIKKNIFITFIMKLFKYKDQPNSSVIHSSFLHCFIIFQFPLSVALNVLGKE